MIDLFFPVAGLQTADGNMCKQNFQCMNNVLQNMNGNWKLLYKKLLKATSLLFLQRYVQPQ